MAQTETLPPAPEDRRIQDISGNIGQSDVTWNGVPVSPDQYMMRDVNLHPYDADTGPLFNSGDDELRRQTEAADVVAKAVLLAHERVDTDKHAPKHNGPLDNRGGL